MKAAPEGVSLDAIRGLASNCAMDLPAKIAQLMSRRRVSQVELASAAGMQQNSVSRVLNGKQRLYLDQAKRIASYLDVSVEYLADDTLDVPPPPTGPDGLTDDERHVLTIARHLGVREAIDRLLLHRVEPPTPADDPRITGRLLPPPGSPAGPARRGGHGGA
jgi:transcriptional regulator with XRE-family HTH domain